MSLGPEASSSATPGGAGTSATPPEIRLELQVRYNVGKMEDEIETAIYDMMGITKGYYPEK